MEREALALKRAHSCTGYLRALVEHESILGDLVYILIKLSVLVLDENRC
jgi:hypothetical protein